MGSFVSSRPSSFWPANTTPRPRPRPWLLRQRLWSEHGVRVVSRTLLQLSRELGALKQRVNAVSEQNIARLLLELDTGGNIRLEEGSPSDVWYTSCVDLVNSRFSPTDFAPHGIAGIRVRRVTRVHNRFLRNRFEARMEAGEQARMEAARGPPTLPAGVCGTPRAVLLNEWRQN